ncbi:MBOAT family protein [Pedobacter sp. MC2016-15]|uniref:MBOAT family O-acyltransferase n=1 Tax=Pedobacter sp. MC2016-15 TaxID=2994473 RepID=UPI0022483E59|nr:MBOAT family O-acyltransferase [Pedobacter sp. MC2016-15]MCX2477733.1 MBOAT family protein [Pedobacter sp. MC2016-15]
MLFNSFEFLIYFPVVTLLFFLLPHRIRWVHLLLASFIFYMTFLPIYVLILLITIVIDYVAGIYIEKSSGSRRKWCLILSLIGNIGFLCLFKYYDFIIFNINSLLSVHLPMLNELWLSQYIISYNNFINTHLNNVIGTNFSILTHIILPIGLSFHTFQAMSYTIEVYRGNQKAERHFGIYALYVMFYPQLVAGPIERPQNILHQFHEKKSFDFSRMVDGLKLMLLGFFKKLIIADRLAIYVNTVYGNAENHSGVTLLFATMLFAFQIYCDFSAYSEIAIGAARVMGFDLMTNFRRPYFSRTMAEFWRRWHISLSSWFTDYLYIPMGGNRVAIPRAYLNIMIVFLVSGLWHGASWTFIIWGGINGVYLIAGKLLAKPIKQICGVLKINMESSGYAVYQRISTFFMACLAWIFFRADGLDHATLILKKIIHLNGKLWYDNPSMLIYTLLSVMLLLLMESVNEFKWGKINLFTSSYRFARYTSYAVAIILILLLGVFDGGQFIYFQF